MMPYEAYTCYLALKNHFTKEKYDYHKYRGKVRATQKAFYNRKDRFWFEKVTRQKKDKEIEDFFVSNFITCTDPQTLWIGEMIKEGEDRYTQWKKKIQSLSYTFKGEVESLFENQKFDTVFDCSSGHPIILKKFLSGDISLETLVICDRIVSYRKDFDKKLMDPVWESVSLRIKKYSPFLHINVLNYRKILKETITND